jgi:hypothetical protein
MDKNEKTVGSLKSDTKKREYRCFVEAFKLDQDEVISLIPNYEVHVYLNLVIFKKVVEDEGQENYQKMDN